MNIKKPMTFVNKSYRFADLPKPMIAQPKFDGVFVMKNKGKAMSRQMKPVQNRYVAAYIEQHLRNGMQGEFILSDPMATFQDVTSAIMSRDGEPDFYLALFDWHTGPYEAYVLRLRKLRDYVGNQDTHQLLVPETHLIETLEELQRIESRYCGIPGCEGLVLRDPNGSYKFGRCTIAERNVFKHVFSVSDTAVVHQCLDNKTHPDRCGALMAYNNRFGAIKVGSGLDAETLIDMKQHPERYIGRMFTFKYKPDSVKDKPRQPIFTSWIAPTISPSE